MKGSQPRYRVRYRLGGRESTRRYAGSFRTKREALARAAWVAGELAAMRVPDLTLLEAGPAAPTVEQACERWRKGRVDVADGTRVLHRVALGRVVSVLGQRRLDQLTVEDVNKLVVELARTGRKRETIRKSVKYLAAVLEDFGVEPNPARDKRVRLPHEEPTELEPPTAAHVEVVLRLLPRSYRLPLLWLDWSGARVASIETVVIGDYDEPARRVRRRRPAPRSGSSCRTSSLRQSRRRYRRARTVTQRHLSSAESAPTGSELRSHVLARRPASLSSLHTTSATGVSRSSTAKDGRGLR
jgi:hypothetical protein